jgi:[acyl-carrier-protein] S-malonyltransferase
MGTALRRASRGAEEVFLLAESITDLPLRRLCDEGPLEELTRTSIAQVAVVAVSLAAGTYLRELVGRPPAARAVAGHSVGELAAFWWAGVFDTETTIRLVHQRATLMERDAAQVDGTMVAVLNLDASTLRSVCEQASDMAGGSVEVANLNAPGQVVLSGDRGAIAAAAELATAAGARRVIPLNVGGPFHSRYMAAAARDFRDVVAAADFNAPDTPIVLNTSGEATIDPDRLRQELAEQITSPVRWEESVHALARMGCAAFVELGPGDVLTGLVRRTLPEASGLPAGIPDAIQTAAALLVGAPSYP